MRYDVSVIGLFILDILGRPVTAIPDRGNVDFIEEIRLTVAGTAGGTVVDTAKLGCSRCRSPTSSTAPRAAPACRASGSRRRGCAKSRAGSATATSGWR